MLAIDDAVLTESLVTVESLAERAGGAFWCADAAQRDAVGPAADRTLGRAGRVLAGKGSAEPTPLLAGAKVRRPHGGGGRDHQGPMHPLGFAGLELVDLQRF